ncbi:hypothetical protein [Teredinibacter haidensis]|uniref:hypothetical protein n=1 Tax=Teredinibacter haidensis TaxID=2731755 RepID=UPI0015882828|nr:hypothetical protein [Teredinibacter haidensis]
MCLRLVLLALIPLQLIAAVADPHQFHQPSNQHEIIAEHVHDQSSAEAKGAAEQQGDTLDCHHCCHCHSMASTVLPVSFCHISPTNNQSVTFTQRDEYSSQAPPSLYRPPIV